MKLVAVLFSLSLTFAASEAAAYVTNNNNCHGPTKWPFGFSGYRVNLYANPGNAHFPAGSALRAALQTSVDRWNAAPHGLHITLAFSNLWPRDISGNGVNEAFFTDDPSLIGDYPARAISWYRCGWMSGTLEEVDIVFHPDVAWTTSNSQWDTWPYGGPGRPFVGTALHELGHFIGLDHEADLYNIMGRDWTHVHTNWETVTYYPGEDATSGARSLYGTVSADDLGVVHWKHTGAGGEYSIHGRTVISGPAAGTPAMPTFITADGETGFIVRGGTNARVQFTFENNGSVTHQHVPIRFVLSSNNIISPSDRTLLNADLNFAPDFPDTVSHVVSFPADAISGATQFVGVIVDPANTIAETMELNNATYIPLRIDP